MSNIALEEKANTPERSSTKIRPIPWEPIREWTALILGALATILAILTHCTTSHLSGRQLELAENQREAAVLTLLHSAWDLLGGKVGSEDIYSYNYNRTDLVEAKRLVGKALALDPNNPKTLKRMGDVHIAWGNIEEAERSYRKSIELGPNDAATYNSLGIALQKQDRYLEAESAHRKAVELAPGFAALHSNLGIVLRHLERYEESEVSTRKAIQIDPLDAVFYNNLGIVFWHLKLYGQAETAHKKAIRLDPTFDEAHYNHGVALRNLKRYEDSISAHKRAIELSPGNSNFYLGLATSLLQGGFFDEAQVELEKAKHLDEGQ